MKLLSAAEAAARLGVTSRRVLALIELRRLPAEKIGRDWVIREADVDAFAPRPSGRPKKEPSR